MGFYIRKGFNFGPLRLNLSRSGLGMSVGVKGARIGVGPKGSYVHMGREGLYYRHSLNHFAPTAHQLSSDDQYVAPIQLSAQAALNEVKSADAASMTDASSASVLAELTRVQRRIQLLPITLVLGFLALVLGLTFATSWVSALVVVVFVIIALIARHLDVTRGTAVLNYFLDPTAQLDFEGLVSAFEPLKKCDAAWHVDATARTGDWKHQSGADTLLKRSRISPCLSKPPRVVSNLDVPMLDGGRQKLYFFPDRLLIYESRAVGAVSYDYLESSTKETRFVEDGRAPSDAQVIDHTWQYVNKRGGPDRRFANNPQRDVALYSTLVLATESGFAQVFQFSKSAAADCFVAAISTLKKGVQSSTTVH